MDLYIYIIISNYIEYKVDRRRERVMEGERENSFIYVDNYDIKYQNHNPVEFSALLMNLKYITFIMYQ